MTIDFDSQPERTCIVTRRTLSPQHMIRFVVSPEGQVVPDIKANLPGRGAWVTCGRGYVIMAVRKNLFERAFKTKVEISSSLSADIDSILTQDALQILALSNKAGQVTTGWNKVEDWIGRGLISVLIHAADGSCEGERKMRQLLRRQFGNEEKIDVISLLSSSQLDHILGSVGVVHVALKSSPLAEVFKEKCGRLQEYRRITESMVDERSP